MIPTKVVLPTKRTIIACRASDYIQMFYGPPGVGKTSFVDAMAPRVLFISTDRGTRFLKTMREEVFDWSGLNTVVKALEEGGSKLYDIICLDHVDDIVSIIETYTCKQLGIEDLSDLEWSKGYKQFKKNLWGLVQRLLKLGPGLILICHEHIKPLRGNTKEVDKIMPDLGRSAWKILIPKCDLVGYCGFGKKDIRVVRTSPTNMIYCKDRTLRIKPESGCEYLDGKKFSLTFRKG